MTKTEVRPGETPQQWSQRVLAERRHRAEAAVRPHPNRRGKVVRSGWFYLGTYLKDDKYEPKTGTCTLLVRHFELRAYPAGRTRLFRHTDALKFATEDEMVAWIEEHDAEELPPEADGNPQHIPDAYRP